MLLYKNYSVSNAIELFRNPDNGLWFLIVLFFVQLWYFLQQYVVWSLCRFKENRWLIEGIVGVLFLSVIFVLNKYNDVCSGLYTNANYYMMFFTGSYVAKYMTKIVKNDIALFMSLFGFFILAPKFHMWQNNSSLLILSVSIFASIVVIRIGAVLESIEFKCDMLLTFGKSSLAVYALHFYLVKVLSVVKLDTNCISMIPLFVFLSIIAYFVCLICVQISNIIGHVRLLNLLVLGRK